MKVYLVRSIAEKELQGLFWAVDIDGLAYVLDEMCDRQVCEFAALKTAAGFYTEVPFGEGRAPRQLGEMSEVERGENDGGLGIDWNEFHPSERFWNTLVEWESLVWERFP